MPTSLRPSTASFTCTIAALCSFIACASLLVKSLVNLHGGTIVAHSAGLGHGSTFIVSLPILQAGAVAAAAAPPPLPRSAP